MSFNKFVTDYIKLLAKKLSIPTAVLEIKIAKEPSLIAFLIKSHNEMEAAIVAIKLQLSRIMFSQFIFKNESKIRKEYSQYRHMWE